MHGNYPDACKISMHVKPLLQTRMMHGIRLNQGYFIDFRLWIKDLSVARHQAWRSAGKVVLLRCHEIIPDQHRHQDWPKGTLHASYAHVAYMGTERF